MQSQSDPAMENSLELETTPEPASPEFELAPLESEAVETEAEPGLPAQVSWEILRNTREARGESLNDIARTLKISAHQLEALENGRFDVLPGPTFARGFLRNYARYLDVPPEPLLEGISARTPTTADLTSMLKLDGNVQPAASPRPPGKMLPVVLIVLVALVLVGLAVAGIYGTGIYKRWLNFQFGSPAAAPVHERTVQLPVREKPVQLKPVIIKLEQPVPINIAPESARDPLQALDDQMAASAGMTASVATPGSAQTPSATVPAVPEVATLRLSFQASALAQVRDSSGKLIFTRTGAKGNSNSVKGKPPFSVMVKQANNVRLEFNGQVVDLKGHTNRDGVARLTLQ
jgi:cytoskeleton protein RodZ